jgi:hypothetical protein
VGYKALDLVESFLFVEIEVFLLPVLERGTPWASHHVAIFLTVEKPGNI